tara:strand:- start:592 stop:1233 length:642 start_codon:yes stop_codon:yes gene_type:complete
MKKTICLIFFILVFMGCSSEEVTEEQESNLNEESNESIPINDEVSWSNGLGEPPEEFISNWNRLISSISNDEDTILFFSINPNNVNWASEAEQTLVYQFGKITSKENVFVLNLNIDYNVVQSLEFFAPASNDEITSQQTKLFFLMILSISDSELTKEDRESLLSELGVYEDVSVPSEYGQTTTKNQVEYQIEPLIVNGQLIGINFYSKLLSGQ